ncbi:unnamed protein product, partial [Prorocentrum cordatum]
MSVSGGSDVEVGPSTAFPPPAQRRRASSTAASARSSPQSPVQCFACLQPCAPTDHVKKWHGYTFHASPCWNPVRSRTRICLGKPNGLRRELDIMVSDPEQRRAGLLSFGTTLAHTGRAIARDTLSQQIDAYNEEIERSAHLLLSGVMRYTKQQCKDAAHQKVQDKKLTLTDLPHDFASVQEDLQRVVAACKTEKSKIPDAKKEQVPALQDAYANMLKQKADAVTKAVALQDHLQPQLKKATSNERSMYQVRRWKKEKMSHALVKEGASAPFAKHFAGIVTTAAGVVGEGGPSKVVLRDRAQDNPIEVQYDTTKVAVWTKDNATVDSQETALWYNIMNMFGPNFETFLKSKMESVTAELRNHANWPGALGRMTDYWPTASDSISPFDAKDVQSRGAEMWIVGAKMDAMRMHPANVPVPGVPCLIYAAAGPLLIHAVEMKSFLDMGIAAAGYESHQQTPSGVQCLKAGSAIMLCDGDVACVPAGWHWSLVAVGSILSDAKAGEDGDAKPKPKGRVSATVKSQIDDTSKDADGFVAVASIFSEKLVESLPANVRGAIRLCNKTHFASKSGRATR